MYLQTQYSIHYFHQQPEQEDGSLENKASQWFAQHFA